MMRWPDISYPSEQVCQMAKNDGYCRPDSSQRNCEPHTSLPHLLPTLPVPSTIKTETVIRSTQSGAKVLPPAERRHFGARKEVRPGITSFWRHLSRFTMWRLMFSWVQESS